MINTVRDDSFIDHAAASIQQYGLQTAAILFLEAGHPLTFLGGQLLWIAQPVLSLFIASDRLRQAAALLEEPAAVAALVTKLEADEA